MILSFEGESQSVDIGSSKIGLFLTDCKLSSRSCVSYLNKLSPSVVRIFTN